MKDIELPRLLKPDFTHSRPPQFYKDDWLHTNYWGKQSLEAYARAAVEADRAQRVPDGWKLVPVEPTPEMLRAGDQKTWALPSRDCWRAMLAAAPVLASTPAPAQQEPSEAEMVCAEAYQVVGCLLSDLGLFETEAARKILDNLSEARMVHQDVLPWESAAQPQEPPQQERKPMTDEERHAIFAGLLTETVDTPTEMFRLIVERVERHHKIQE